MHDMIETEKKQFSIDDLRDRIARYMGPERVPKQLNGIADTSDFYRLDYDDVVILGDRPYLIRNNEPEVRFGTVVIGRRGISKKEEFMFGSTSTKILHIAKDCSIWVIE